MAEAPLFREPISPTSPVRGPRPQGVPITVESKENTPSTAADPDLRLLRSPVEGIPDLIDSAAALENAAHRLGRDNQPVAVDTERAQGYRYGGGAYLVQVRKDEVGSFLIDSRALPDLSSLAPTMTGPWILHAADQDLACMQMLGLVPTSIFDTEIAARLLGFERFSLGAVTEHVLGITLEKSHQNEDWSLRPLPIDWLRYAALDVELLPELRSQMTLRLDDAGRMEWAEQEFVHELTHPLIPRDPSWRDLRGLGKVRTPLGLAVARELWTVREELGRELDVAPGRLLATNGIVAAALADPRSKGALTSIPEFRRTRARKHTDTWWSAVARAHALPEGALPDAKTPHDPKHVPAASMWKRLDPVAWERLQTMRALASRAAAPLGIQPEVVLEPRVQREVAWRPLSGDLDVALQSAGARAWQIDNLSRAITADTIASLR